MVALPLSGLAAALLVGCAMPVEPIGDAPAAVTNGMPVEGDPAVAALLRDGRLTCTATLIDPHVLLTAGHCVSDDRVPDTVFFGSDPEGDGLRLPIEEVLPHPLFDATALVREPGRAHDIGLVVLTEPPPIEPVRLATEVDGSIVGDNARVVGFGDTVYGSGGGLKRSGIARITALSSTTVRIRPSPSQTCDGDSGGPLFIDHGGEELLAGVHSVGKKECEQWAIESRVDAYTHFIETRSPGIHHGGIGSGCAANGEPQPIDHVTVVGSFFWLGRRRRTRRRRWAPLVLLALLAAGCATGIKSGVRSDPDGGPPDAAPAPACARDADCNDLDACNGAERCLGGACHPGIPIVCDDGVDCTVDSCEPRDGSCHHMPSSELCGGVVCHRTDGCLGRRPCASDADCDDGARCDGAERCAPGELGASPITGCVAGIWLRCEDDGLACTLDRCEEPVGCVHRGEDRDGDGHAAAGCGEGDDCDDLDSAVSPSAGELCNGVDDDCDGACDDGLSGCRLGVARSFDGTQHDYTAGGGGLGSVETSDYFSVYADAQPGLVALYRCTFAGDAGPLLTIEPDCEIGTGESARVGYVSIVERCGARPLYRLYKDDPAYDHFYTLDRAEADAAVVGDGYTLEGVFFHVW